MLSLGAGILSACVVRFVEQGHGTVRLVTRFHGGSCKGCLKSSNKAPCASVYQFGYASSVCFAARLGFELIKQARNANAYSFKKTAGYCSGLIIMSALMSWKGLMILSGSESPVVVVLSGSMEPAFFRGDILLLRMGKEPFRTGEIVVYNADDKAIPVVHRIIQVHERQGSEYIDILTKGDNNPGNDRLLFEKGRWWLQKEHIIGRAVGYVPNVGMLTIVMNDYPWLKYTVLGILGVLCLLGFDE